MGFWPYFRHAHSSVDVFPSPTPLGRGPLTSASGTVTTRLFADRLFPLPGAAADDGATGDPELSAETPSPAPTCFPSPPDAVGEDAAAPSFRSPSIPLLPRSGVIDRIRNHQASGRLINQLERFLARRQYIKKRWCRDVEMY
jgi:hypothetical protein